MPSETVMQALAVTSELLGTNLSEAAARVMLADLSEFSDAAILDALKACRREVRGRLTLADIIGRIPSGHPTPEQAWALVAHAMGDERETVVLTGPMRAAFHVADAIGDDRIAARMAFLEVYRRELSGAGSAQWEVVAGWDPHKREATIRQAVEMGRLSVDRARKFLPDLTRDLAALPNQQVAEIMARLAEKVAQ